MRRRSGCARAIRAPFDVSLFHEGQRAFDVVYAHGETAFAAGAKAAGCTFADGGGMLVAQAVATVQAVCDVSGIDCELSFDELFEIMANAPPASTYRRLNLGTGCKEKKCRSTIEGPAPRERRRVRRSR